MHPLPDPLLQRSQVLDYAVVCEQPPPLLERVRVTQLEGAGGSEADVGNERRRGRAARLARKRPVSERSQRLLLDMGLTTPVEVPEAGSIRLAMALNAQRVRRLEQPERGRHRIAPSAHAKQATHPTYGRAAA